LISKIKKIAKQHSIIVFPYHIAYDISLLIKKTRKYVEYYVLRSYIRMRKRLVLGGLINKSFSYEELANFLGVLYIPGSSKRRGVLYHELPFKDISFPTHRKKLSDRVKLILSNYDVLNKTGIDLGCSVGGFVFSLQLEGAKMVGYDHDSMAIEFARAIEGVKRTGAIFVNQSITEDLLKDFKGIDFCIWFSQFMWLVKEIGAERSKYFLHELSRKINHVMFFETSIGDGGAGNAIREMGLTNISSVRNMLISNTCFTKIESIGCAMDGWGERPVFACSDPRLSWGGMTSDVFRISRDTVKKVYVDQRGGNKDLQECKANELAALTKLNSRHFPKIVSDLNDRELILEYCGVRLTKENMPKDFEQQIREILLELRNAGLVHRDIIPGNLFVKDEILRLIDFGWAVNAGQEYKDAPRKLGTGFRKGEEFDDEYSLRKSIEWILEN
jgi:hypothetical protein